MHFYFQKKKQQKRKARAAHITVTFAPMSFLDLEMESARGQVTVLESNNEVEASRFQVTDVHLFTGLRVYRLVVFDVLMWSCLTGG